MMYINVDIIGPYLVSVLHQVSKQVIQVQDAPITVLHAVGPNQEVLPILVGTQKTWRHEPDKNLIRWLLSKNTLL